MMKNQKLKENMLLFVAVLFAVVVGFAGGVSSAIALFGFIVIIGLWVFYTRDLKSLGVTTEHLIKNAMLGAVFGVVVATLMLPIYLSFPETSLHFFQLSAIFSEKTGIESQEIIRLLFPVSFIIGSLTHELFYRGFLQNRLSTRIKPLHAILLAACLFGWGHFPEGIYSAIIGFYEGIICGMLFYKTGNIISTWSFRIFHIGTISGLTQFTL